MKHHPFILGIGLLLLCGCTKQPATLTLTSTAFGDGGMIPASYTCDGADISPPLAIGNVPKNAKGLAVIMHDSDTQSEGDFLHWAVWTAAPDAVHWAEGSVPAGVTQGQNDANVSGYTGPCPPAGSTHHYVFEVFAYDDHFPTMWFGSSKSTIEDNFHAHVIGHGALTGLYQRTK